MPWSNARPEPRRSASAADNQAAGRVFDGQARRQENDKTTATVGNVNTFPFDPVNSDAVTAGA